MLVVTTATLAALSQLGAAEPSRVRVGDAQIDGRILRPYVNVWRVSTRRPDGSMLTNGAASDVVDEIWLDGRRYLTRAEGTTYIRRSGGGAGAFEMTFNIFDPVTLRPRLGESRTSAGALVRHEFLPPASQDDDDRPRRTAQDRIHRSSRGGPGLARAA